MAEQPTEVGVITTEIACRLLMLTRQRLDQLAKDGWIARHAPGRWRTFDLVQGYIRFLREAERRASRTVGESRIRDARATEIEIRTAERTRQLIALDEALESNALVVGFVRTEFGGLPARFTRDLALRRDIEKVVNESLARIADRLNAEAENLAAGRVPDDAVADDDAGSVGEPQPELSTNGSGAGPA